MSKNFELLQQLGKEPEVFLDQPAVLAETAPVKRPVPHLEGMPAEEVGKLVQRLFLLAGSAQNRMVVFTSASS